MRIVQVTIGKSKTINLGNYEATKMELALTADCEGDDADQVMSKIEQTIDRELDVFVKAHKPVSTKTKTAPAKKASEKTASEVAAEEPESPPDPSDEVEPDLGLGGDDTEPEETTVTLDEVRASLRILNEKADRSTVKALLDEYSDTGKLPDVPEKNYKALFLKSEEALANLDKS